MRGWEGGDYDVGRAQFVNPITPQRVSKWVTPTISSRQQPTQSIRDAGFRGFDRLVI